MVVSIIALLIARLLPALSGARESARIVQCSSNIRQVNLATLSYVSDSKDWLPYSRRTGTGGLSWEQAWAHTWVWGDLSAGGTARSQ